MMKILFGLIIVAVVGSFGINSYFSKKLVEEPKVKVEPVEKHKLVYVTPPSTSTPNDKIEIDEIVWLLGEEAIAAAIKDGKCDPNDLTYCLEPNRFYLRNESPEKRVYTMSNDVEIYMQTYSPTGDLGVFMDEKISLETFRTLISSSTLSYAKVPYNMIIIDNTIVKISEVYMP